MAAIAASSLFSFFYGCLPGAQATGGKAADDTKYPEAAIGLERQEPDALSPGECQNKQEHKRAGRQDA
jgi:hypothetical protein